MLLFADVVVVVVRFEDVGVSLVRVSHADCDVVVVIVVVDDVVAH